jgi:hypothetical protein
MTETSLTANIVSLLRKEHGCFVINVHGGPYQMAGLPDILVIKNGVHLWLEFKTANGVLSGVQKSVHKQLRGNGASVFLIVFQEPKMWKVDDFYTITFRKIKDAVRTLLDLLLELERSKTIPCDSYKKDIATT